MDEKPRIGVYVCHCGLNIAGVIDVQSVAEFAAGLHNVAIARDYMYMCSDPGQNLIKEDISNYHLNRVVVASCSPMLHEHTFRVACQEAGLNPYLFEMANIREQDAWVTADHATATEKAKSIVAAAVNWVQYQQPLEIRKVPVNRNVVVVGGGIAGMRAALDIADAGINVYLIEREPSIGGHMAQFDKTFPTLDCASCIFTPLLSEVGRHPNIELMTYSEVEEVSGYIGNFTIKVRKKARYVDVQKCTGCGTCVEKCPFKVVNEFDEGMKERKVIYIPFAQAVPNAATIDAEHCRFLKDGKCGACAKFCEAGAIDFNQQDEIIEVEAGAIVMATGYDAFDPSPVVRYGYGRYDNVITSLQFERMSNASGPTLGTIQLKDGTAPKSVAIVHCVGSRDTNYHDYCSRVCCMYALKYAHLIHEKTGASVYQMYIDMRCFGKGYEEFYKRIADEGTSFIRGKVGKITDKAVSDDEKGKLIVIVEDTLLGSIVRVPVDMVVLCTALEPRKDVADVARVFGINRSSDGFFLERHPKLNPVSTMSDGIYIAGCCQGPKDIPDTVAQASAAAGKVLSLINRGMVEVEAAIAAVDTEVCTGCGQCAAVCAYKAIEVNEKTKVAEVNPALCKGCGACSVTCPSNAIRQKNWTPEQFFEKVDAATREYR
ncbi:MAG: CoB--CoM heterodisulfide reductase iron-sulfur subunit A family protein [Dehalococcoidales bacterium]|nr:CoB--CoM heterodisulfide reductase iron-sulfur subunit A family protein [Dehalococcoidales bacterium]